MRQAHFVLSVACRAENNRTYLKQGVELRPGYLAKWIEFSVIGKTGSFDAQVAIDMMRRRRDQNVQENQRLVEADHLRYTDGVGHDFDTQAFNLGVDVMKARLGRECTQEERTSIQQAQRRIRFERQANEKKDENFQNNGFVVQGENQNEGNESLPGSGEYSFDSSDEGFDRLEDNFDYVEEQRKALSAFNTKLTEARGRLQSNNMGAPTQEKKKKKKKKKGTASRAAQETAGAAYQ